MAASLHREVRVSDRQDDDNFVDLRPHEWRRTGPNHPKEPLLGENWTAILPIHDPDGPRPTRRKIAEAIVVVLIMFGVISVIVPLVRGQTKAPSHQYQTLDPAGKAFPCAWIAAHSGPSDQECSEAP